MRKKAMTIAFIFAAVISSTPIFAIHDCNGVCFQTPQGMSSTECWLSLIHGEEYHVRGCSNFYAWIDGNGVHHSVGGPGTCSDNGTDWWTSISCADNNHCEGQGQITCAGVARSYEVNCRGNNNATGIRSDDDRVICDGNQTRVECGCNLFGLGNPDDLVCVQMTK